MSNRQPIPTDVADEADLFEQQIPLVEETEAPTPPTVSTAEADEADLTEQAIIVPDVGEDDYDR